MHHARGWPCRRLLREKPHPEQAASAPATASRAAFARHAVGILNIVPLFAGCLRHPYQAGVALGAAA